MARLRDALRAEAARRNLRRSFRNLRDRCSHELRAREVGETPHDELNRLISMHLFLAMLAAPLASQHKDHPLRQLLSHR